MMCELRECARDRSAIMNGCRGMRLRCEFRTTSGGCSGNSDVGDEAVAATGNGFDEAGTFGGIAEGLADLVDRLVEPVVEIHERVGRPECLLKFLSTDDRS